MPQEIERKFLVRDDSYKTQGHSVYIHQGFLSTDKERVVRVRIAGKKAYLTVKGITKGIGRAEYEYKIPLADAKFMLENLTAGPTIEKNRYYINKEGFIWEVDEFMGDNEGLVVAEIELDSEDQDYPVPEWLGEEVTGDPRYYNANLVEQPFKSWLEDEVR
jgi:adenylate cyclase